MKTCRLTLLSANSVYRSGFRAEHGLSVWVEFSGHCMLWDTGQGLVLRENAAQAGVDLRAAEAVALSHGHYDHIGGLAQLPARESPYPLFAHPGAFIERYTLKSGKARLCSHSAWQGGPEALPRHFSFNPTRDRRELLPGIWVTGEVPRETDFEDVGGAFYLDADLAVPDPIVDDQSLVLRLDGGWLVVLGCAHAGIVNTLRLVDSWEPGLPFLAVMGGCHLVNADDRRMNKTLEALQAMAVRRLFPIHCTGNAATRALAAAFPEAFEDWHVGDVVRVDGAGGATG